MMYLIIYGACAVTAVPNTLTKATVLLDEATPDRILFQGDKIPGIPST